MSCYQGADVVKKNLFDDNMEQQHQPELVNNSTIGLTPEESDSVYSLGSSNIPSSLSTDRPPSTIGSWSSSDSIFLELDNELPHPDKVNSHSLTKFQIRKMENCRVSLKKLGSHSWWGPNFAKLVPVSPGLPSHSEASKDPPDLLEESPHDEQPPNLKPELPETSVNCDSLDLTDSDSEDCDDINENMEINESLINQFGETSRRQSTFTIDKQFEDGDYDNGDIALDLDELSSQVEAGGCASVLDLHLAVQSIVQNTHIQGPKGKLVKEDVLKTYQSSMEESFPWFDISTPSLHWAAWEPAYNDQGKKFGKRWREGRNFFVKKPYRDHGYAAAKILTDTTPNISLDMADGTVSDPAQVKDNRKCLFCYALGDQDPQSSGRLIYFRFGEWLHVNCAHWSSEVYEAEDNTLQNVVAAATRSRTLLCSHCSQKGATIGCCHNACTKNYHFACGMAARADFKEDKSVYCLTHAQKYAAKLNCADFTVDRILTIDLDESDVKGRPFKKKTKAIDFRKIKYSVGGLNVDSLGSLVNFSGTEEALVPVGLSANKIFWSVLEPEQRTVYRITTRLVAPLDEDLEEQPHLVLDHSAVTEEDAEKRLNEFFGDIRNKEAAQLKTASELDETTVMPPYAVSKLWPWLDYKQIKNRPVLIENPMTLADLTPNSKNSNSTPKDKFPDTNSARKSSRSTPVVTPRKKLNRAVCGFRNSPLKSVAEDEPVEDLSILDNEEDLEVGLDNNDDQLISEILSSGNFEAELECSRSNEDVLGSDMNNFLINVVTSEPNSPPRWNDKEEFRIVRTWFNANKLFKVSEVATQTTLLYDDVQIASDNVYTSTNAPKPIFASAAESHKHSKPSTNKVPSPVSSGVPTPYTASRGHSPIGSRGATPSKTFFSPRQNKPYIKQHCLPHRSKFSQVRQKFEEAVNPRKPSEDVFDFVDEEADHEEFQQKMRKMREHGMESLQNKGRFLKEIDVNQVHPKSRPLQGCSLVKTAEVYSSENSYATSTEDDTDDARSYQDVENSNDSSEFSFAAKESSSNRIHNLEIVSVHSSENDDENSRSSSVDSTDILSYVTENMEKRPFGQEQILNKILMMNGDQMFEIGPQERVFELNSSSSNPIRIAFPSSGNNGNSESIPQLDGTGDEIDPEKQTIKTEPVPVPKQTPEYGNNIITHDAIKQEPSVKVETALVKHESRVGEPIIEPRVGDSLIIQRPSDSSKVSSTSRPSTVDSSRGPTPSNSRGPTPVNSSRGPTPGNSRGATPARTPVTPLMDLEGDIPGVMVDHPVLCSTCGNTYGHRHSYDAHLAGCTAMIKLLERADAKKREADGDEGDRKRPRAETPDIEVVDSADSSPRKDFSIAGLLSSPEKEGEANQDDDIEIIGETIRSHTSNSPRRPTAPGPMLSRKQRQTHQPKLLPATSKPSSSTLAPTSYPPQVQYVGTIPPTPMAAPMATNISPYTNVVQYGSYQSPYLGLQPSLLQPQIMQAPIRQYLGPTGMVNVIPQQAGYIMSPQIIQQQGMMPPTIFYNNMQYSVTGIPQQQQPHLPATNQLHGSNQFPGATPLQGTQLSGAPAHPSGTSQFSGATQLSGAQYSTPTQLSGSHLQSSATGGGGSHVAQPTPQLAAQNMPPVPQHISAAPQHIQHTSSVPQLAPQAAPVSSQITPTMYQYTATTGASSQLTHSSQPLSYSSLGPPVLEPQVSLNQHHSIQQPSAPSILSSSSNQQPPRKVARVQPMQPTSHIVRPIPQKATPPTIRIPHQSPHQPLPSPVRTPTSTPTPPKLKSRTPTPSQLDPLSALSSLSKSPMTKQVTSIAQELSITHRQTTVQHATLPKPPSPRPLIPEPPPKPLKQPIPLIKLEAESQPPLASIEQPQIAILNKQKPTVPTQPQIAKPTTQLQRESADKHRSVATQSSRPPSRASNEIAQIQASSERAESPHLDHDYASSPEPESLLDIQSSLDGVNITTKASKTNSIKIVLQRDNPTEAYNIREVTVKDGSKAVDGIHPISALKALKIKAKISRKHKEKTDTITVPLDSDGSILHTDDLFVNEQTVGEDNKSVSATPTKRISTPTETKTKPHIVYDLSSEDGGFSAQGSDITLLWRKVYEAVSNARASRKLTPLPPSLGVNGEQMLGLTHSALRYLLEQFPGAKKTVGYKWKHQTPPTPPTPTKENTSGCARAEPYTSRSEYDMFSWLASRHRKKPHPNVGFRLPPELAAEASMMVGTGRRATSLDLPMAMRFRHLAKEAREAVAVYASGIHGRGLYCKREISNGEMVIEYAGEEIRAVLTDNREKLYDNKGIGCYMFRIDDDTVIDATMRGNAARFINHSCDPNCYSKICDILGKKHIIIFALRKIFPGEELTYDYKFPIEDVKLSCFCGARKCRKYLN